MKLSARPNARASVTNTAPAQSAAAPAVPALGASMSMRSSSRSAAAMHAVASPGASNETTAQVQVFIEASVFFLLVAAG